jgi:CRP/FNR family transcriptional regulator
LELVVDRAVAESRGAERTSLVNKAGRNTCSPSRIRQLSLPQGAGDGDIHLFEQLMSTNRRVRRGEYLFSAGDAFRNLYAVRSGFLKSSAIAEDGQEQVTGFQMAGDLIGLDGIDVDRHKLSVVALEDSQLCVVRFQELERTVGSVPRMQRQFHRMMSREIVREQGVMTWLGTMGAEQRVAAFLLSLADRFAERGFSPREFNLRMTREEIGSYLGLTLETVSRIFSRFQERGLLAVRQRWIRLDDIARLRGLLSEPELNGCRAA